MRKNYAKFVTSQIVMSCINVFITGTVLQTFLLESGVDEHTVSVFESAVLILQSLVIALSSGPVEKKKNTIGFFSVTSTLRGIVMLPMLVFCVVRGVAAWQVFAVIAVFKIVGSLFEGVYSVVSYKLPYHVIKMESYGRAVAIGGLMGGILATLLSVAVTYLNGKIGFFNGMRYVLCLGILLAAAAFFISGSMKRINGSGENIVSTNTESNESIFRYKPFYILLLPNLCRGICTGVLNVVVVIGYHFKLIDGTDAIIVTVILQIASVIGALLYAYLCNRNIDGGIILISSLIMLAVMPFMTNFGTGAFLLAYFVAKTAMTIIDNAIPVAVVKIVDYSHIGRYSAWRMITHTVGTAIGSGIAVVMADAVGGIAAMTVSGLCIVLCGAAYYICLKVYGRSFYDKAVKRTEAERSA